MTSVTVQELKETMGKNQNRRKKTKKIAWKALKKNMKDVKKSIETHIKLTSIYLVNCVGSSLQYNCGQSLISTKHTRYYKYGATSAFR